MGGQQGWRPTANQSVSLQAATESTDHTGIDGEQANRTDMPNVTGLWVSQEYGLNEDVGMRETAFLPGRLTAMAVVLFMVKMTSSP